MQIEPTTTVREIVLAMPYATGIFERLGIDYCCGGNRTLAKACRTSDIQLESVMQALTGEAAVDRDSVSAPDWQHEPLTSLILHILEQHHQFTRHELARAEKLLAKVCAVHGSRHAELLQLRRQFTALEEELTSHMLREEQVLFPFITRMELAIDAGQPVPPPFFRTVRNPVRTMSLEHDKAGAMLREMRLLTNDYRVPDDGCFSWLTLYQALEALEADLHQHIHLENNILFQRAVSMEESAAPEWGAAAGQVHQCFSS